MFIEGLACTRGTCEFSKRNLISNISLIKSMKIKIQMLLFLTLVSSIYVKSETLKVQNFRGRGYDSHVELNWETSNKCPNTIFKIYVSVGNNKNYVLRGETKEKYYLDFVTDIGRNITLNYKMVPVLNGKEQKADGPIKVGIKDFSDDELLEMVQQYTFRYFWDFGDTNTGLAFEREKNDESIVTIGGSGFGVMAIIVGVERGWITSEQALDRLLFMTHFLETTGRFHGMWAHWYNAKTGKVRGFSKTDNGGDIVESSFMMQGLLTAKQYFNQSNKKESQLRDRITKLWHEMEWDWYTKGEDKLIWHWSPDYGFEQNHGIRGYNECFITYILAESSPTHPISAEAYHKSWAGWDNDNFANYTDYYGIVLPLGNKRWYGGPLFFAHYSYLGLDPRELSDKYANYWEQNKRHTLINRAYCIDNPYSFVGYSEDFWGLTAGDRVPSGYSAHTPGYQRDVGTITPTAAISSIPYTPEESLKVLKNLYRNHGKELWGIYGFYDGINLSLSDNPKEQVRKTYIAIDQGPIVVMIENHRTGLLWNYFMKNKDILKGLKKLGFRRHHKEILVD